MCTISTAHANTPKHRFALKYPTALTTPLRSARPPTHTTSTMLCAIFQRILAYALGHAHTLVRCNKMTRECSAECIIAHNRIRATVKVAVWVTCGQPRRQGKLMQQQQHQQRQCHDYNAVLQPAQVRRRQLCANAPN